ncbi:MAG: nicotinate-nucleotide adenylyltransferase [Thermoleophilia bacterium]|nr:nicotinate-nucleotide adenylyltransferase [Thermoleophilia bacterium]
MRIGVMGGSFDPPHDGHIALARHAARQLGLDRVLLVPVGIPPHKPDGPVIPAERRLMMVEAAAAADPVLEASRAEIDRPGPSFTVDTLERIAADHPGADLWFILGADQLAGFGEWRRPDRIVEIARLAVARRPGAADPRDGVAGDDPAEGRVDLIDMPEAPISSTIVRDRIARGEDIRDLVPGAVADILEDAPPS